MGSEEREHYNSKNKNEIKQSLYTSRNRNDEKSREPSLEFEYEYIQSTWGIGYNTGPTIKFTTRFWNHCEGQLHGTVDD